MSVPDSGPKHTHLHEQGVSEKKERDREQE